LGTLHLELFSNPSESGLFTKPSILIASKKSVILPLYQVAEQEAAGILVLEISGVQLSR
jgi:hypothetical protein